MLQPGNVFGGTYHLIKSLGKGGMGEVWLAQHVLLNEPRAIKVMLGTIRIEPTERARFIQGEARNALRLDRHPNIVRVYELGLHEDIPYIVMEYVEGNPSSSNLKDLLKIRGKLTIEETGEILEQLAAALGVAHRLGIIHRDIKPANILLNSQNQLKLTDFGLTKDLEGDIYLTANGHSLGTPAYMSPEQAQGQATFQSDIYSVGAVIYELLTGRIPFTGTTTALLVKHATSAPTPPQNFEASIPPELGEIILKSLAKLPEERYSSVEELAGAYKLALQTWKDLESLSTAKLSIAKSEQIEKAAPETPKPIEAPATRLNEPLKSKESVPNNIPPQLTKLIGRENEVAKITQLLSEKDIRLITLTGPGGTGKTRLSLQVAENLLGNFLNGIYFVELATINDAELIPSALAQTLGLKETAERPILETLKEYLHGREILFVLDNFEQLVSASGLLTTLLVAAPHLKFLISSREALRISGEQEFAVPPLKVPGLKPLPDLAQLLDYEAIALFVQRAKGVKVEFNLTKQNAKAVAEICIRLDGLPLAIELAAARIKVLSAEQIAARLSDQFKLLTGGSRTALPRQQTLQALIDWSYDLLSESERMLFRRLAVFSGGWAIEAAEIVCAVDGLDTYEILDLLTQLVSKSLVVAEEQENGEIRYRMMETIRHYAINKLKESDESNLMQSSHLKYFTELGEVAEPKLRGEEQSEWLALLELEHDNLRVALDFSLSKDEEMEKGLRLAGAIWRFWYIHSHLSEGENLLETFLLKQIEYPQLIKSKALNAAGNIAWSLGKYDKAINYHEQNLVLRRESKDKRLIAQSLNNLGAAVHHLKDYTQAKSYYEEALALHQEMENMQGIAMANSNLGEIQSDLNNWVEAQLLYEKSLEIDKKINYEYGIAIDSSNLGFVLLKQGNLERARQVLSESLLLCQKLGDKFQVSSAISGFGRLLVSQGENIAAVPLFGVAEALCESIGIFPPSNQKAADDEVIDSLKSQIDEEIFKVKWEEGRRMSLEEAVNYALTYSGGNL